MNQVEVIRAQDSPLTFVFYNVENLFHPDDDPPQADDEFTEAGDRHWNYFRYYRKIAALCKVLLSIGGFDYPDLICFSEIENKQVMLDLVSHPLMMHADYGILHREGPDHRGIDVAMLYNRNSLTCIDTSWIPFLDDRGRPLATREMLSAWFTSGADTLICTAVHWTSRYGGVYETEKKRLKQAEQLLGYLDSLSTAHPGLTLITGGDFNDNSSAASIRKLTSSGLIKEVYPGGNYGSYKYQGKWETIDHVFVNRNGRNSDCSCKVYAPEFLLEKDETYSGMKPFRTYIGYRYNGGISDHLPLVLTLAFREAEDH